MKNRQNSGIIPLSSALYIDFSFQADRVRSVRAQVDQKTWHKRGKIGYHELDDIKNQEKVQFYLAKIYHNNQY